MLIRPCSACPLSPQRPGPLSISSRAESTFVPPVLAVTLTFNNVFGTSLFDYLQQDADAADAFDQGMTNLSSMLAYAVLMAYDFEGISSIVDIGGGQGKLLGKILQFNPDMSGTVFDTPSTIEAASQELSKDACCGRCSYVAGDFFTSVPEGADAYLLCGVIHDWDDDHAITILKNCRKAMTENSRVLLVDMIVPDAASASFSKLLDLNMLVMNGGRERTKAEFCALLEAADYKLTRIAPTMAPQSIIEAVPKVCHRIYPQNSASVLRDPANVDTERGSRRHYQGFHE